MRVFMLLILFETEQNSLLLGLPFRFINYLFNL